MSLSRRTFLGITGGVVAGGAAAAVAGPVVWQDLVHHHVHRALAEGAKANGAAPAGAGRVLVVIDLGGGNDGLNTLVPANNGAYHAARPGLGLADDQLVSLAGTTAYGLNPNLAPLQKWWEAKHLVAVDGVAIAGQSRSHFMAGDVWWTGEPRDPHGTGWLGRWLDADGDHQNPLRAVSLGDDNLALTGRTSLATVVADPSQFALSTPKGLDADSLTAAFLATSHPLLRDPTGAAAQQAVPDALHAVNTLTPVLSGPKRIQFPTPAPVASGPATSTTAAGQPDGDDATLSVTSLLEVAAGIIDLQIGTRVIMVSVGGFDTHADQATRHPPLLADLAKGLDGFLAEMARQGRADDVLIMTTSEFGRRVAENGSGTDHGQGSVHFLAGPMVNGGQVVGRADLSHLEEGDLPIEIDARSMYAAALDWMGGPTDEILGARYDRHGLMTI